MSQRLTQARDEVVRLQNAKTASERQLRRQLEEAQATLEDREEDLRMTRNADAGVDAAAREAQLLERLDEEEKRVALLESELARSAGSRKQNLALLQDELSKTTESLEGAKDKVASVEGQLAVVVSERDTIRRNHRCLQQEHGRVVESLRVTQERIRWVVLLVSSAVAKYRTSVNSNCNFQRLPTDRRQTWIRTPQRILLSVF